MSPALLAGERAALARAISRVERGEVSPAQAQTQLAPHVGRAQIIGITGAPGAGKSTLLHALLGELLQRGLRIGVVAVDPSSPITGGAVLGDRVRMGEHGANERVFIRSIAARGHLGGLTPGTEAMVDLMDAAGHDVVIIETVGAGQSEVEVMRVADTRIVVCPPGLGDNIQAIKAGILEIADLLVVTKADLPGSEHTARDLRDMLHLRAAGPDGAWAVPVLSVSSTTGQGIAALVDQITAHAQQEGRAQRLRRRPEHHLQGDNVAAGDVRYMAAIDPLARFLGIRCTDAGAGFSTTELVLRPDHFNFNGTCHGGVIFALADTAFGIASNSHGMVAAGIDAHITYQKAGQPGDTLVARATEVSRSRKLAIYRVDVTRAGDGASISSFTGTVYVTSLPTPAQRQRAAQAQASRAADDTPR